MTGVVLAYINNTAGTFNLTADQVIYLKSLGAFTPGHQYDDGPRPGIDLRRAAPDGVGPAAVPARRPGGSCGPSSSGRQRRHPVGSPGSARHQRLRAA